MIAASSHQAGPVGPAALRAVSSSLHLPRGRAAREDQAAGSSLDPRGLLTPRRAVRLSHEPTHPSLPMECCWNSMAGLLGYLPAAAQAPRSDRKNTENPKSCGRIRTIRWVQFYQLQAPVATACRQSFSCQQKHKILRLCRHSHSHRLHPWSASLWQAARRGSCILTPILGVLRDSRSYSAPVLVVSTRGRWYIFLTACSEQLPLLGAIHCASICKP